MHCASAFTTTDVYVRDLSLTNEQPSQTCTYCHNHLVFRSALFSAILTDSSSYAVASTAAFDCTATPELKSAFGFSPASVFNSAVDGNPP